MVSSGVSANGLGDGNVWPPGFRFHPTDEELVLFYLKRKICHKKLKPDIITETDVYKWEPEELPGLSILKTGDRQWFFFSPRDRKYPNGARSNRGTRHGYWKVTGKDRAITCNSRNVGVKKTLVFYKGRAPNGERTDWIMHEYTLDEEELKKCQNVKEYYALYKFYKKSGPGPKNGEQYGAPFREEDWADDECPDFNSPVAEGQVKIGNEVDGDMKVSYEFKSSHSDIEEFMRQLAEPVLELTPVDNNTYTVSQVVSEEAHSTLINSSSSEVVVSESLNWSQSWSQQCNVQANFGLTHSAISPLQSLEGLEVTSPNISKQEVQVSLPHALSGEDFLEIDDLLGPEPTLTNMDDTLNNMQFENGLSELDLFHDAAMFLQDMGPIDQAVISHPYSNSLEHNGANYFGYQTQYNQDDACLVNDHLYSGVGDTTNNQLYRQTTNQVNRQLYSGGAAEINNQLYPQTTNEVNNQLYLGGAAQINNQLYPQTSNEVNNHLYLGGAAQINNQPSSDFQEWNGFNSVGFDHGSAYNTPSGVVSDPPNLQTGSNENQSGSNGNGSTSRLSSALWAFLEAIPTTPASAASESALVNRALVRLSSFSRTRANARNINNVAAGTNIETTRRGEGRKSSFVFFSIVVAVCAILWVILRSVRQWGISISSRTDDI